MNDTAGLITAIAALTWAVRGLISRIGGLWLIYRAQQKKSPLWVKDGWLTSEYCTDPATVTRTRETLQNQPPAINGRPATHPLTSDPKIK